MAGSEPEPGPSRSPPRRSPCSPRELSRSNRGASVGCLAGNHIQAIYTQANRYALYLLAAAALAILALIIRHRLGAPATTRPPAKAGTAALM